MDWLVIPGALVALLGLAGLIASAVIIVKAKRAELEDEALRARLARGMVLNMASLFLSVIGLMMVVMGVFLA